MNILKWETIVSEHAEILTSREPSGGKVIEMTPGTGPGHYRLIHELCRRLENTPRPWPVCRDIKIGRDGELCFYVDGATDEQYEIIEMAEELSHEICGGCGSITDPKIRCCP